MGNEQSKNLGDLSGKKLAAVIIASNVNNSANHDEVVGRKDMPFDITKVEDK